MKIIIKTLLAGILVSLLALPALGVDGEPDGVFFGNVRVVLDPAHGGADEGSHGVNGIREKDVVLSFAKFLADKLESEGYEVRLTRESDKELSAVERAAFANRATPALFLSIQASGVELRDAKGVQAFYPAPVEAGIDPTLWRAGQHSSQPKSKAFAEALHESLAVAGLEPRGAKAIESPLLGAVTAPAALITLGNISWSNEADLLTSEAGRKALASAISKTIGGFIAKNRRQ